MKGTVKIVAMIVLVLMLVMTVKPVFAWSAANMLNVVSTQANNNTDTDADVARIAGGIIAFIRNLAIVVGIVMVSVIGIKYMVGSAEEKASYKKTLIPLVVGIILVVAAATIISVVFDFANNLG